MILTPTSNSQQDRCQLFSEIAIAYHDIIAITATHYRSGTVTILWVRLTLSLTGYEIWMCERKETGGSVTRWNDHAEKMKLAEISKGTRKSEW